MLLQIVLPSTLDYMNAYNILKYVVRWWCNLVGGWLQLDSYLLSSRNDFETDEQEPADQNGRPAGQANPLAPQQNNLGDRHQALLMVRETQEVEPYFRPDHFYLRLIALLICVAITSILLSLILLVVPGNEYLSFNILSVFSHGRTRVADLRQCRLSLDSRHLQRFNRLLRVLAFGQTLFGVLGLVPERSRLHQ
jgi:hypothetical protein